MRSEFQKTKKPEQKDDAVKDVMGRAQPYLSVQSRADTVQYRERTRFPHLSPMYAELSSRVI